MTWAWLAGRCRADCCSDAERGRGARARSAREQGRAAGGRELPAGRGRRGLCRVRPGQGQDAGARPASASAPALRCRRPGAPIADASPGRPGHPRREHRHERAVPVCSPAHLAGASAPPCKQGRALVLPANLSPGRFCRAAPACRTPDTLQRRQRLLTSACCPAQEGKIANIQSGNFCLVRTPLHGC